MAQRPLLVVSESRLLSGLLSGLLVSKFRAFDTASLVLMMAMVALNPGKTESDKSSSNTVVDWLSKEVVRVVVYFEVVVFVVD